MIFFTSDQHFFHYSAHGGIISYCSRPFKDVGEMNEVLKNNWNNKVKPCDTVYILGDFIFPRKALWGEIHELLCNLNGTKLLVPGDHDMSVGDYHAHDCVIVLDRIYEFKQYSTPIILCHWPIRRWAKSHFNSIHLFGHCHNANKLDPYEKYGKSFNIGVDVWNYEPVSLDEVVKFADTCEQNHNYIPEENRKHH